jgi:hypothetical protein
MCAKFRRCGSGLGWDCEGLGLGSHHTSCLDTYTPRTYLQAIILQIQRHCIQIHCHSISLPSLLPNPPSLPLLPHIAPLPLRATTPPQLATTRSPLLPPSLPHPNPFDSTQHPQPTIARAYPRTAPPLPFTLSPPTTIHKSTPFIPPPFSLYFQSLPSVSLLAPPTLVQLSLLRCRLPFITIRPSELPFDQAHLHCIDVGQARSVGGHRVCRTCG